MATKELVLDFKELHRIGVQCPKCECETLFDLSRGNVPYQCSCGEKHDKALYDTLYQLRDLYRNLAKYAIRVRVKILSPGPHEGSQDAPLKS